MKFSGWKIQKKDKLGKIWGFQNDIVPLKQGLPKIQTTHARQHEISKIGKYEKIKFDKIWRY